MKLKIYQIDTFTESVFGGNPAAVVPLDDWLPDSVMQSIAAENNLSETVFFIPNTTSTSSQQRYEIRWFTPTIEVDLCGHATLATAYVLYNCLDYSLDEVVFNSRSGELGVKYKDGLYTLDFPAQIPSACEIPKALEDGLGVDIQDCYSFSDYVVVVENETDLLSIKPNFSALSQLDLRGVIVTAPSNYCDFVARFFAPNAGILEDPVTGSAYTQLTPYWSKRLNKTQLSAQQLSQRKGHLYCEDKGERVLISGKAVKYLEGEIEI